MNHPSRSRLLWISATLISGLLYFFAFHFFPQTFPLINLDITMDLNQALKRADNIAKENNFGPIEHHNAAMFHTDVTVKTFIELEAGGKDAFVTMMEKNLYMPYTWRVRHFKEHEKNESTITFMPNGTPYGFITTISDNTPGPKLVETQARTIAQDRAQQQWNVDFSQYSLVESSQKIQPSKRIDHTFVYERINETIGEGLYRLKIVISGETMTELSHFVKVPESFNRRYAEMRSANDTIAWASTLAMAFLYLIGGCLLSFLWITRKRWGLIKQPFKWALFLACANTLVSINQLPFLWMHYNTAQSLNGFLIQLFLSFFVHLIAQTAFLSIIIMTAENLTRRAFGHHPQLWSLHTIKNASSYQVLGRTLGGYLMVGLNCAFVVGFYLLSTRYLNWWIPSEMLFDPNVLATYAPWFSSLAQSLNAGFMEECLFRAIPLAGAALLGTRYGKRNWWIGGALILQAIIFGGAHANYPTQPSYARLVELFVPSLIWGVSYLRWGLLPTIIAHCVYDIIWFSLPIFASHLPHALIYKIIIILITLSPLFYIMYARIRNGFWTNLSETYLNKSWQPEPAPEEIVTPITSSTESLSISRKKQSLFWGLGILGLIAWLWATPFCHDGITITIDRKNAIESANLFLHQKNITLNAPWKTLPLLFSHFSLVPHIAAQHKFIWREGNKELYHSLLGTYLEPAHWTIRYAQFDGDILQRAEEHKVMLYNATPLRHAHQLPENAAGEQLTQEQARSIAHQTISEQYKLDPTQLIEISAEQAQLPHRRNWLFIFSHNAIYPLSRGQARIALLIAGNKVIDAAGTIHVPEEWERLELNDQNILNIIAMLFLMILAFFLLWAIFLAFRQKQQNYFSGKNFLLLSAILTILTLIDCANSWTMIVSSFNTTAPLINQMFQYLTILISLSVTKAIMLALGIGYVSMQQGLHTLPKNWRTMSLGIGTGLFFAGIMSIAHKLVPINLPLWPNYDSLTGVFPTVTATINNLINYLHITTAFMFLFLIVEKATQQWKKYHILFYVVAALVGISMIKLSALASLPVWIITGVIIGFITLGLYQSIIRYDYSLIPLATGSFTILNILQQGVFNAYPGVLLAAGLSIGVISIAMQFWYRSMNKKYQ